MEVIRTNLKPFFSIFVPIYNAEEYLEECITSVLNQTFKSWELILVDDGSTDSSGKICDEYAKKNSQIKVIHKKNGGEFSSRYAALQVATGKYATGLDADDLYVKDYLETVAKEIGTNDFDCIKWSFTFFGEQHGIDKLPDNIIKEYKGIEYLDLIVKSTLHSFCSQAIKLDIIKNVDYSDAPHVRMSEDYMMVIPALCYVKTAKVINYYGYMYRIHNSSASRSITFDKIYDLCEVSQYGLKKMKEALLLNPMILQGEQLAFLRCAWPRIDSALHAGILSDDQIVAIRNHISYKTAYKSEKIKQFGVKAYIKMKIFRHCGVWIVRKIYHLI